jgi:hypothetical protein
MSVFPCPFLVDVNNDGKKDLLCCPNASTGSENKKSVLYYENTSSTNAYQFNYVKNNFLQDEMIENGEGAYPTFFDNNSDGLQDLILGNTGRFQAGELRAQLMLFQNIGTTSYPKYKLIDDDFLNFSAQPSINFLICTFGDLDADGDKDMIIGNGNGELMYYENNPIAGVSNFVLADANYEGIDVGYNAAPQIIDLNRDGLLDIIIGTSVGRIKYYRNIGNAQVAQFIQETSGLGDVFTGLTGGTVLTDGYCTPQFFDVNGSYHLLCGSKTGRIFRYDNIDGNLSGNFNKLDTNYLQIWEGRNSSIAISDINNDGQVDMMIGNISGGLNYYSGDITGNIEDFSATSFIKVYPNPVHDKVNIVCDENIQKIIISDIEGREIITTDFNTSKTITISTNNINPGIYFVKIVHAKGYNQSKIIITK